MEIVTFEDNKVFLHTKDKALIKLREVKEYTFYSLMLYVYNVSDYNAYPIQSGYNEIETHQYAIEESGLPPSFIPNKTVEKAIEAYYKIRDTVAIKYLRELYKALNSSSKAIKLLNVLNEELLIKIEALDLNDPEELKNKIGLINQVISNNKSLFEMATSADSNISKLKELEFKVKKEEESKEKGLGGGVIVDSMIPNK